VREMRILSAMSDVNEEFITEAREVKKSTGKLYLKVAAFAACAMLSLAGLYLHTLQSDMISHALPDKNSQAGITQRGEYVDGLLVLQTVESIPHGGMAYEAYDVYQYDVLIIDNPWDPSIAVAVMPVYRNNWDMTIDDSDKTAEEIYLEKKKKRDDFYARLNAQLSDFDNAYFSAELAYDYSNYDINIHFDPVEKVPSQYNTDYFATYGEVTALSDYLLGKYGSALGMKKPTVAINGGDYNIYNQRRFYTKYYDADGDIIQQIYNYSVNSSGITVSPDNDLIYPGVTLTLCSNSAYKKVGDYPVISYSEALEKLLKGDYLNNILKGNQTISDNQIAAVELLYIQRAGLDYIMPFYKFYVENNNYTPINGQEGMKQLIPCYIPAIQDKYLQYPDRIPFN